MGRTGFGSPWSTSDATSPSTVGVRASSPPLVCQVRLEVTRMGGEAAIICLHCLFNVAAKASASGVSRIVVRATSTIENRALEEVQLLLECSSL